MLYFMSYAWDLFFFLRQPVDESASSLRMGTARHRMQQKNALRDPGTAASGQALKHVGLQRRHRLSVKQPLTPPDAGELVLHLAQVLRVQDTEPRGAQEFVLRISHKMED